ncbi:unnamed protein product [Thelazia callipaeda]|uniref:Thioredoxin domain-containing protein n=1 Tax=Thelazia callipaeda TaxID=103827 RepID=A0A0N5CNL7_THECL|nr:unnamed protein product [Thelazia callipaeda]
MYKGGFFCTITVAVITQCLAFTSSLNGINWLPYSVALSAAKSQNKPIFVLVYNDYCTQYEKLKNEIEKSPYLQEFQELSNKFVMTNVADKEIREPDDKEFTPDGHYKPRIVFLNKNGRRISTVTNSRFKKYLHFYDRLDDIVRDMKKILLYHNY